MRVRSRWALRLTLLTVVVAASLVPVGRPQGSHVPEGDGPLGVLLARPALAQSTSSFPADQAGISAFIKFPPGAINLNNLRTTLFTTTTQTGANFVIGQFKVGRFHGTEGGQVVDKLLVNVSLYADTNGWLVAFLPRDRLTSEILFRRVPEAAGARWGSVLARALDAAAKKGGAATSDIDESKVGYFHWGFPQATRLALALRGRSLTLYFAVPAGAQVADLSVAIACASDPRHLHGLDGGIVSACGSNQYSTTPLLGSLPVGTTADTNGVSVGTANPTVNRPVFVPEAGPTKGVVHTLEPSGTGTLHFGGIAVVYSTP